MKVTSKKWRTGCLGLLGLIGACALLSRLPKPPSTATQAQRLAPLVAVNTPAPTFTRSATLLLARAGHCHDTDGAKPDQPGVHAPWR